MVVWNTGLAAERARHNLKLKKKKAGQPKATSRKLQAARKKDVDSHKIPDIKDL